MSTRTSTPPASIKSASVDPVGCLPFFDYNTRWYQSLLSNTNNFSPESRCDIFQVQEGKPEWKEILNDAEMLQYLAGSEREKAPVFRVIFSTLENVTDTAWDWQLSLSKTVALDLFHQFQISPVCLDHLLAGEQPPSTSFASDDARGQLRRLELSCVQHLPHSKHHATPWSICMTHDVNLQSTTYVVAGTSHFVETEAKSRLRRMSQPPLGGALQSVVCLPHPFIFHLIAIHEGGVIDGQFSSSVAGQLSKALDKVGRYSEQSSEERARDDLESLTVELNKMSQRIDGLTYKIDCMDEVLGNISEAHQRYAKSITKDEKKIELMKMNDVIKYCVQTNKSQRVVLKNLAARKATALNLLFNLVTQQDAATSTSIARGAKADSNSMKIIAALTMMFLPGTFLSSVFGMSSLEKTPWWLYVALAIPLTFVVAIIWWLWLNRSFKGKGEKHRAESLSSSVRVPSFQSRDGISVYELQNRGSLSSSVRPASFQSQNRTSVHEVQNLSV